MKQCIACNTNLENEAVETCPVCGAAQNTASAQAPANKEPSGYDVLVNGLRGKKYLALCVTYTVVAAFTFLSSLSVGEMYKIVADTPMLKITPAMLLGATLGSVASSLLPLLMCVGMWLLRAAAQKASATSPLQLRGLHIYRVSFLVCNIINCLTVAALGGIGFFLTMLIKQQMNVTQMRSEDMWIPAFLQVMAVLCFVVLIFMVIYIVQFLKTLKAVRQTAETQVAVPFVSAYVIVIHYFKGVATALLAVLTMVMGLTSMANAFLFGVSGFSAIYHFLIASGLSSYKKALQKQQVK